MITVSAFKWVPDFAQGQVRDLRVRWALEEAVATRQLEFDRIVLEHPTLYRYSYQGQDLGGRHSGQVRRTRGCSGLVPRLRLVTSR